MRAIRTIALMFSTGVFGLAGVLDTYVALGKLQIDKSEIREGLYEGGFFACFWAIVICLLMLSNEKPWMRWFLCAHLLVVGATFIAHTWPQYTPLGLWANASLSYVYCAAGLAWLVHEHRTQHQRK